MGKEKSKRKAKQSASVSACAYVEGDNVIVNSKAKGNLECAYAAVSTLVHALVQKIMQLEDISYVQAKRKVQRKLRECNSNVIMS